MQLGLIEWLEHDSAISGWKYVHTKYLRLPHYSSVGFY